jgi:hypothetical protein
MKDFNINIFNNSSLNIEVFNLINLIIIIECLLMVCILLSNILKFTIFLLKSFVSGVHLNVSSKLALKGRL